MSFIDVLAKIYHKFTGILKKRNIIIFESNPVFSDNAYWFYKYLIENTNVGKKYKFVWVVREKSQYRRKLLGHKIKCVIKKPDSLIEKIRFSYYQNRSKYLIDSNDFIRKKHDDQVRVFLWHGMPFKIVRAYEKQKDFADINTITSDIFKNHFKQIGDKDENLLNLGNCRNDILAKNCGERTTRTTTNIIWMPTYRQHKSVEGFTVENRFPLGLPIVKNVEDLKRVNKCLADNFAVLYLRPHPSQDLSVLKLDAMSNIIIANDDFLNNIEKSLYEFLLETDALISDYSSIYYDYLMLDRPIALATEDVDEFTAKWPLFYDGIDDSSRYNRLLTADDLIKFIENTVNGIDERQDARLRDKEKYIDYHDDKACERLYNCLKENYGL